MALFAPFTGLVYSGRVASSGRRSQIQQQMLEKELYKRFTFRSLIDEVDVIEYFTYRHRAGHWGEITEKQRRILEAFDVPIPEQRPSGKKARKKRSQS